jgi:hypothetical protein
MTIVVSYDKTGVPHFRSLGGPVVSEKEEEQARALDALIKKRLGTLVEQLKTAKKLKTDGKGNVYLYWEFGRLLRDIYSTSGLVSPSERFLFYLNADLYAPEQFKGKDRSRHRVHTDYCFRLGQFPKEKALRIKWGEWVTLFDSTGSSQEPRFDKWIDKKMEDSPTDFNRSSVRTFVQIANTLLGKTETRDLSDVQLFNCYEAAWELRGLLLRGGNMEPLDRFKMLYRDRSSEVRKAFGKTMMGEISPIDFATASLQQSLQGSTRE